MGKTFRSHDYFCIFNISKWVLDNSKSVGLHNTLASRRHHSNYQQSTHYHPSWVGLIADRLKTETWSFKAAPPKKTDNCVSVSLSS